jgi:PhnB protein
MTYGDYKEDPNYQAPDHIKHLIMHAEIEIFGSKVMVSDTPKGFDFDFILGNNFSLAVTSKDKEQMKHAWELLKEGGKVFTDLGVQPFVPYYGYLIDKFGVGWQFIYES